ncbi:MAG: hypothetical protein ABW171_11845 [Steroidobacter sp.]
MLNSRLLVMAGFATLPLLAQATVPAVDGVGRPAVVICGVTPAGVPIRTAHMDKIIFQIVGDLKAELAADQPALDAVPKRTDLDIKVIDDPRTVADLEGKVLTFLGASDTPDNREGLRITDVEYAVICPRQNAD